MKRQRFFLLALVLMLGVSGISAQQKPKTISGGVVNGTALSLPAPTYPAAARAVGASGKVHVQVLIDEAGNVISAEAIAGHPLLRTASEQAALSAVFKPVLLSGTPVQVSGIIIYDFDLPPAAATAEMTRAAAISGEHPNYAGKTISGGVVNGKAISLPIPEYPAAAQAVGASGAVNVQVLIDETGNVVSSEAASGHPLLRSASEKAAREARFAPTTLSGAPVKVSGIITYVFDLPPKVGAAVENYDVDALGIGAVMRMMTRFNSDPRLDTFSNIFFDVFAKEIGDEAIPAEISGIEELPKANSARRAEILGDLDAKIRKTLEGGQLWQFAVGEIFGDLIAESWKRAALRETDADYYGVNLLKLKDQMISAPRDFPVELRRKLLEVAEFGDKANLDDEAVLVELEKKLYALGNIIFDSEDQE